MPLACVGIEVEGIAYQPKHVDMRRCDRPAQTQSTPSTIWIVTVRAVIFPQRYPPLDIKPVPVRPKPVLCTCVKERGKGDCDLPIRPLLEGHSVAWPRRSTLIEKLDGDSPVGWDDVHLVPFQKTINFA